MNSTARYVDARNAEIFWQLVDKVDKDVTGVNERADRLVDDVATMVRQLEQDLDKHARSSPLQITPFRESSQGQQLANGREAQPETRQDLSSYVKEFVGAKGPVLDIGCGQGEFLELLKEANVQALGVDSNPQMVAACEAKGLAVVDEDCFTYLKDFKVNSLAGVFVGHLFEYLSGEQLEVLIETLSEKLRPGAKLVIEATNPKSFAAVSQAFVRDPERTVPLPPNTLCELLEAAGFEVNSTKFLSPEQGSEELRLLEVSESVPVAWNAPIRAINENLKRLNQLFFEPRDYFLVAVKRQNV